MSAPSGGDRPQFARAAAATYATSVTVACISLVNVIITSRSLGPSGRGEVAFLTTVGYITAQLSILGISQANVNLASREPGLSPVLAGNSLILSGLFGAAAAAIVSVLVYLVPAAGGSSPQWLLKVVLASLPILVLQDCLQFLAQAHYQFRVSNAAWLLVPVVTVSSNGLLALAGLLTVEAAVCAWLVGQTLSTLLLAGLVQRRLGGFGRPRRDLAVQMVTFGVKAHLGRIMLVSNYRLDQWILGSVAGARQLGTYSVAVAWAEALFFVPTALATVQRPDLARASSTGTHRQGSDIFRAAVLVTVPIAIGLAVMAPFLCTTVFGEEFSGAVSQVRILAIGAFGIVALKLLGDALTAQGRPLRQTAAIGVAFVVIVALDLALIAPYGGVGASVASAVAYSAGGAAAVVIFLRTFGGPWRDLVPGPRDARAIWRGLAELLSGVRRSGAVSPGRPRRPRPRAPR